MIKNYFIGKSKSARGWCLILLLMVLHFSSIAQNFYPVQSTVQLIPPYSVYLPDYAQPGNEKFRIILIQKDITQPNYQLKLYLSVSLNGKVIMRTSRTFNPGPITLSAGEPTVLSGAEIAPYLDSRNLDFVGYSKDQYEKTHALPEGAFQICVTAYDYVRQEVQVSNIGCSFYYLAKTEPPMVNLPACGTKVPLKEPQYVVFSWLPRNTSSPNSAANTEYEFNLYEVRVPGRNPNDIVLSTVPVFTLTTDFTQLVYGPGDPPLVENMQYVWRVQAKDKEGKDMFRNHGFSEICTFTYGGPDPNFVIGVIKDFAAEVKAERKARLYWTADAKSFDSYRIQYKKIGDNREWFFQETKEGEIKVNDLEPETQYEARIQGKRKGFYGDYSEIIHFTTPKPRVIQCGQNEELPVFTPGPPLLGATKGMTIHARGMDVMLTDVEMLGGGWYRGKGTLPIYYLGGANYNVTFDRIYIDENSNVTAGRINLVSRPIDKMADNQLNNQEDRKKEKIRQENRDKYEKEGVVFYEKIFDYSGFEIKEVTVQPNGDIRITDEKGNQYVNTEIPKVRAENPDKAIIIQDKNGDQVIIKPDGKVEKVPGGGLKGESGGGLAVSKDVLDVIQKALKELRKEYNDEKISSLRKELERKKQIMQAYITQVEKEIGVTRSPTSTTVSSNMVVLEMEKLDDSEIEQEHVDKGKAHKLAERELNKALVVKLFANESNSKKEYELIAGSLTIKDQKASDYLSEQKSNGTAESELIKDVKTGLLDLIDRLMNKGTP